MPRGRGRAAGRKKRKVNGYLTNNSIKNKRMYAALRKKGYSKEKSARISNAKRRAETLHK